MKSQEVLNCSFSSWYPFYRAITMKSLILDLPDEVVSYLLSDGLVLPDGCEEPLNRSGLESDSDDEVDWNSETSDVAKAPNFDEFNEKLKYAIEVLGGKVFPKLNWSSPRDAIWITMDNTLCCTCPRDIYLLVKSSDFVTHDLTDPFQHCEDCHQQQPGAGGGVKYQLVLRQWHSLNPAGEFRCFVKDRRLIGVCQRHASSYHPHISDHREDILADVQAFFTSKISQKFPEKNYTFDVYRRDEGKVSLIDFNPFGQVTDPLMFTWDELLANSAEMNQATVFRCVDACDQSVQPNPFQCYKVPQDFVHLTSGVDPQKLIDLMHMRVQSHNEAASSSEDEDADAQPAATSSTNHNDAAT